MHGRAQEAGGLSHAPFCRCCFIAGEICLYIRFLVPTALTARRDVWMEASYDDESRVLLVRIE